MTYSERELEFTFAKNAHSASRGIGGQRTGGQTEQTEFVSRASLSVGCQVCSLDETMRLLYEPVVYNL